MDDDQPLFKYMGVNFTAKNMKLLKRKLPLNWFDDNSLRMMLQWMENNLPKKPNSRYKILDVQTLKARNLARIIRKCEPAVNDVLLLICNVSDQHWVLYSLTLGPEATRCLWNSYPAMAVTPDVSNQVKDLHNAFQTFIGCNEVEQTVEIPVPAQPNNEDCGIYCIFFIRHVLIEEDDCKERNRSRIFTFDDVEDYRWRIGVWAEWMCRQNTVYKVSEDLCCSLCQEIIDVGRADAQVFNCKRGYGLGHRGVVHQSCSAWSRCPACNSKEVEYTSIRTFKEKERLEIVGYEHSLHMRFEKIFIQEQLHSCPNTFSTFQVRQIAHNLKDIYVSYFASNRKLPIDENWSDTLKAQLRCLLEVSFLKQHAICALRVGDSCANMMSPNLIKLFMPILKFISSLSTEPTMIDCLIRRGEDQLPEGCRCGLSNNGSWGRNQSINLTFPNADYFRMEIENVGNSFRQMLYSKTRPDSWGRKRKDRG